MIANPSEPRADRPGATSPATATGAAAAVECRDLRCTFLRWGQQVRALDGIDFTMRAGEWVTLIGANGSGKSTLLRAIAGWQSLDAGTVRLFGRPQSVRRPVDRVFYVHQNPLLGTAPDLTVFENLLVADVRPEVRRSSTRQLRATYADLLAEARLSDRLKQRVDTLSGGQRQFLSLLIAELREASLILLDEPFAALDPSARQLCLVKLRQLHQSGRGMLMVTHADRPDSGGAGRVLRMADGKLTDGTITTDAVGP